MLIVIISKSEPFYCAAAKIKRTGESMRLECDIRYIEDILADEDAALEIGGHTLYFLTNVSNVPACIKSVSCVSAAYILNRELWLSDTAKFSLQDRLRSAGLSVPNSIVIQGTELTVLKNVRLPLYIKSQKQADTVQRVETREEFEKAMIERSADRIYFEESVDTEKFHLEKVYYINGQVHQAKNCLVTGSVRNALNDIARTLKLDVYSADIFINGPKYFCIDVNPAPALFHSEKARADLITFALRRQARTEIFQTVNTPSFL